MAAGTSGNNGSRRADVERVLAIASRADNIDPLSSVIIESKRHGEVPHEARSLGDHVRSAILAREAESG
jgi:hypothetical protein